MPECIAKGSIVRYKEGHQRVTAVFPDGTANLGRIFPSSKSKVTHKRVPMDEMFEDEATWYEEWQQSESYRCM